MPNRTLRCNASFEQQEKAVGRPIRNTFSIAGKAVSETGKERLNPYSLTVKTRSHKM